MHDWTLVYILYQWGQRRVELLFKTKAGEVSIIGDEVKNIKIPHTEEWGRSVSVNKVIDKPVNGMGGKFSIEMQSGDIFEIEAGRFSGIDCL